jgi:hypothetical protein
MTEKESREAWAGTSKVDLGLIRNRNEKRILKWLPVVLEEFTGYTPDHLAIQDIYALALNRLPARYTQRFSIVLREPVSDGEVQTVLRQAIETVRARPKGRE